MIECKIKNIIRVILCVLLACFIMFASFYVGSFFNYLYDSLISMFSPKTLYIMKRTYIGIIVFIMIGCCIVSYRENKK